jgi:hypothetical protein
VPADLEDQISGNGCLSRSSPKLDGKLPSPGIYELVIAPGALSGISNKRLSEIREHLTEWVRGVAPGLGTIPPNHFARETLVDVGFEVTFPVAAKRWAPSRGIRNAGELGE